MSFKNMFFSEELADKNSELMNMYFTLNKKLDNFMDYLDIELVMNKTSATIHEIAHWAPIDADRFRDYNAIYSFRTKYDCIEGQYVDYPNLLCGIGDILQYLADMDNTLYDAKNMGVKEDNQDYVKFIEEEIGKIRVYKDKFILFYDKAEKSLQEGKTCQDIDYHIDTYIWVK